METMKNRLSEKEVLALVGRIRAPQWSDEGGYWGNRLVHASTD